MSSIHKSSSRSWEIAPTPSLKRRRNHEGPLQLSLVEISEVESLLEPDISLRHLWLSIYLPALPLEALLKTPEPTAVFESQNGVRTLLLASEQATGLGISSGLTINAALVLVPSLLIQERNPAREGHVLNELAKWSSQFTSLVCIEPPSLLLLEIAGSLELFGGVRPLKQKILNHLEDQGLSSHVAIAPTPLAATWLARAGNKVCIRGPRNLVGKLSTVPLHCLQWPEAVYTSLNDMGVKTVGEILRLPRQGFARRFGAIRLLELDRALGRHPDPRTGYRSAERFVVDFDLDGEQEAVSLLLNICWELLLQLENFLLKRQISVQQIGFSFFYLREPATHIKLGRVQADHTAQRWFDLLEIKFESLDLAAPVIAIRLCSGYGQEIMSTTENLQFNSRQRKHQDMSIDDLAERLSARIGDGSVYGVMTADEHRPQYAWQPRDIVGRTAHLSDKPVCQVDAHVPRLLTELQYTNNLVLKRPLWMLDEPQQLDIDKGMPLYQGVLNFMTGPERLETGWWDNDGISRDYFVAVNPAGIHLWIYQNRGGKGCGGWYLHGRFG